MADLDALAADPAACWACDLYRNATQVVFGAGPASARLVLVGEAERAAGYEGLVADLSRGAALLVDAAR